MEPAMVLCAALAAASLGVWLVASAGTLIGSIPDRLAEPFSRVVGSRAVATIVLAIVGLAAVPRSAAAEPIPPIVRLADDSLPEPDSELAATYEVRRGDSLWCIAAGALEARTGQRPSSAAIATFWPLIYEANKVVIGDDPNLILPGQRLTIPEP